MSIGLFFYLFKVVKRIVNEFKDLQDGKYALTKLPYKPNIKIFYIPEDNNKVE